MNQRTAQVLRKATGGATWTRLAWLWAAYYCVVFTIGRLEGMARLVIWIGGPIVALVTLAFLVGRLRLVPREVVPVGAFIVWSMLGGLGASDEDAFWYHLRLITQLMVIVAFVGAVIGRSGRVTAFWWAFMLVSTFSVASIGTLGSSEPASAFTSGVRQAGLTGNPNALGFYCFLGAFGGLALFGESRSKLVKVVCVLVGVIAFAGLIAAASRGAFLALLIGIALWAIMCMGVWNRSRWRPLFLIGVAVTLYAIVDWTQEETYMGARVSSTLEGRSDDETRSHLALTGLELTLEHPVLGVGLGQFARASRTGMYAHSEWIELLATTGVPGFLLFMSIYYLAWRRLTWALSRTSIPIVRYRANLARVVIVVLVIAGALFRPNFMAIDTMFLIAVAVGMSHWAWAQAAKEGGRVPLTRPSRTHSLALMPQVRHPRGRLADGGWQ